MKTIFFFLTSLLLLFSCKDEEDDSKNYFLEFRPRECTHLFVVPGLLIHDSYEEQEFIDYSSYPQEGIGSSENMFLAFHTHNLDIDSIIISKGGQLSFFEPGFYEGLSQTSFETLESQIELDFSKKDDNSGLSLKSVSDYTNLIPMEYRIDGVKNFNISALEKLFDQEPGTSLNKYFKIIRYDPDFIASSDTQNLLYGFSDKDKPEDIDEWLNLSPLAPALMYVAFREVPDDLPESIRFVVEMETDRGVVLKDTSQIIQFNR